MQALIKILIELIDIAVIAILILSVLKHHRELGIGNEVRQYYNHAMFLTARFFLIANIFAFICAHLSYVYYRYSIPDFVIICYWCDRLSMLVGFTMAYVINCKINKISNNYVSP